ncbi:MAG: GntR family transcriptional regulator [Dethiosulfovibrio peptidovorans]|nr:MAG: GntR family transcriptional regulator [Dethiosulfovibrio peptidovorans]
MRDPILHRTSADYVYQELRHRIITKQLKAGQRLPEVNIAIQMGVSRTPVREAIRRLSSEGLVYVVPNSGARLAAPTVKEMIDTFIIREKLENLSVSLVAGHMGDRYLRRLDDLLLDELHAVDDVNLEQYLEAYEGFHRTIAEAGGNRVLVEYVSNILARTNSYVVFYDPFCEQEENPTLIEHRAILDALRHRDAERAVTLMEGHLRRSMECLTCSEENDVQ